jgi:hypothetical protein
LKLDRRREVKLALKFPLVLNRLVVGCERPHVLVADVPDQPAGGKWNRTRITIPG